MQRPPRRRRPCCGARCRDRPRGDPCRPRGSARSRACRPPRPGSSCWSARPGSARRSRSVRPVRDRRDDLLDGRWHRERVSQPLPFDGGAHEGRHHRRRRRRDLDRVPPRRARLDRHHPGRPRRADIGLDVPFGRPRRPAAELGHAHQDDDVRHRPVSAPGRRDRDGSVVARGRFVAARVQPRTVRGAAPAGRLGQDVRPPARADLGGGGQGPLPADVDRRRPRRGLAADRRLARPVGSRQRARRRAHASAAHRSARTRGSWRSARTAAG